MQNYLHFLYDSQVQLMVWKAPFFLIFSGYMFKFKKKRKRKEKKKP